MNEKVCQCIPAGMAVSNDAISAFYFLNSDKQCVIYYLLDVRNYVVYAEI